jgi:hypothetical protein
MLRTAVALFLLALMMQPAWSQTLAPGNPAGVQAAIHITYHQGFIGMSILAVALTQLGHWHDSNHRDHWLSQQHRCCVEAIV